LYFYTTVQEQAFLVVWWSAQFLLIKGFILTILSLNLS
jgi:hypothetical protein